MIIHTILVHFDYTCKEFYFNTHVLPISLSSSLPILSPLLYWSTFYFFIFYWYFLRIHTCEIIFGMFVYIHNIAVVKLIPYFYSSSTLCPILLRLFWSTLSIYDIQSHPLPLCFALTSTCKRKQLALNFLSLDLVNICILPSNVVISFILMAE